MKKTLAEERLAVYNAILKENDGLYRGLGKAFGLSECALWILYTLRVEGEGCTQAEISSIVYQPRQTVNSAMKKLENGGYLVLEEIPGRRGKRVYLTDRGRQLAWQTADRVLEAEKEALSGLTDEEQQALLSTFRKLTDMLRERVGELRKNKRPVGEGDHENPVI